MPADWDSECIYVVFLTVDGSLKAIPAVFNPVTGTLVFDSSLVGDFVVVCFDFDGEPFSEAFYKQLAELDTLKRRQANIEDKVRKRANKIIARYSDEIEFTLALLKETPSENKDRQEARKEISTLISDFKKEINTSRIPEAPKQPAEKLTDKSTPIFEEWIRLAKEEDAEKLFPGLKAEQLN